jgi:ribulose-bisphosphate carboxylase large chain
MSEVITAVYEINAEDPAGRATQVAVEQSHELPTELAPGNAVRDSLAHVRSVLQRPGRAALATVDYPVDLAGGELGQLLVLLVGNVSLQDGVRLVDVTLPARLAAALPGPRLGIAGVRALVGEPDRALLATALKPVGMTPQQLADLAYDIAAGGLHILKDDQGLANQTWAPFAERVPRVAEAVHRANEDTGGHSIYLPCVNGSAAGFSEQVRLARREGAHGVMVLPGVAGFGALAHAAEVFDGGMVLSHPSFWAASRPRRATASRLRCCSGRCCGWPVPTRPSSRALAAGSAFRVTSASPLRRRPGARCTISRRRCRPPAEA